MKKTNAEIANGLSQIAKGQIICGIIVAIIVWYVAGSFHSLYELALTRCSGDTPGSAYLWMFTPGYKEGDFYNSTFNWGIGLLDAFICFLPFVLSSYIFTYLADLLKFDLKDTEDSMKKSEVGGKVEQTAEAQSTEAQTAETQSTEAKTAEAQSTEAQTAETQTVIDSK